MTTQPDTATGAETATPAETKQVLHRLATRSPNRSQRVADERLLDDAEAALGSVETAESIVASGGFARVRTLRERTDDPELSARAESVCTRFAELRGAVDFESVPVRESGDAGGFSSPGEKQCST